MTERKFTDEEIIKALECCKSPHCNNSICPMFENTINTKDCITKLAENALDLINRRTAEIDMLKSEKDKQYEIAEATIRAEIASCGTGCQWCENIIKAEAVKDFAERLKAIYANDKRYDRPNAHTMIAVLFALIDNLTKEMTGASDE